MKKNLKLKPSKDSLITPKKAMNMLPIEVFNSHYGVIKVGENKYSICAVFKSYKLDSKTYKEDYFNKYMELLNLLEVSVQFYFSNQSLENYNLYENLNLNIDENKERINYIVLTCSGLDNINDSAELLYNEMKKLTNIFKTKLLSIEEYINVIFHFYNPKSEIRKGFLADIFLKGLYLNDLFETGEPEFEKNYLKTGDTYSRFFYIRELPNEIKSNYIAELFKLDFELSVSIHIDFVESDFYKNYLNSKFKIIKNADENSDLKLFEFKKNDNENQKIIDESRFFNVGMYVSTLVNDENKLEEQSDLILEICKKYNANTEVLTYQTKDAFSSVMPIGLDRINIRRLLKIDDLVKLIYI
jgi:hypothetical protein